MRSNLIATREPSTVKGKAGGPRLQRGMDLAVEIETKANGSKFVTNCTRG